MKHKILSTLMIVIAVLGTLLGTMGISGCSLLQVMMKSPEVELAKVRVTDPSLSHATLIFDLNVTNPNATDLKIDGVNYKLALNGKAIADGSYDQVTALPGEKTVVVSMPVRIEYKRVFDSLLSAFQKPETEYTIEGNARFGVLTIPFKEKGKVNWKDTQ